MEQTEDATATARGQSNAADDTSEGRARSSRRWAKRSCPTTEHVEGSRGAAGGRRVPAVEEEEAKVEEELRLRRRTIPRATLGEQHLEAEARRRCPRPGSDSGDSADYARCRTCPGRRRAQSLARIRGLVDLAVVIVLPPGDPVTDSRISISASRSRARRRAIHGVRAQGPQPGGGARPSSPLEDDIRFLLFM